MNRQDIFNRVATHLWVQRERATILGDSKQCAYLVVKNEKTLKCAIGILIPDGHPAQNSSGTVKFLVGNAEEVAMVKESDRSDILGPFPDLRLLWNVEDNADEDFLEKLQDIHDHTSVDDWPLELAKFAVEHKLQMPVR